MKLVSGDSIRRQALREPVRLRLWALGLGITVSGLAVMVPAQADHREHAPHADSRGHEVTGEGQAIPGVPFRVFGGKGKETAAASGWTPDDQAAALRTVADAFALMLQHRADYPRFNESLMKAALKQVVIEPIVVNDEGKTFPFLVTRTKEPGRVTLLISGSSLKEKGYLHHPDSLVPVLAREFQWVVSKADTAPKAKMLAAERDLTQAPIRADQEIQHLSAQERAQLLQALFETYLKTVDDLNSLDGQPYYEVGVKTPIPPSQQDSTTKLYEIRVREALQHIVREPYFQEHTPKAVTHLLNGRVWTVAFVKIDQRDWATRTRVLPEEKAVVVGVRNQRVQPAAVLVNVHRLAAPDDPFYPDTQGLPMGALSTDRLARVIALEIQHNIHEKSQSGHMAQDALTSPK
ncbi:MAG: hypothetical protein GDA66_01855 [Nitrospira sp. CR1.2]|nr:hypothetical protein [Nitrospira sp. CR1.2]